MQPSVRGGPPSQEILQSKQRHGIYCLRHGILFRVFRQIWRQSRMAARDRGPGMNGEAKGPACSRKSFLFGLSLLATLRLFRCPAGHGAIPRRRSLPIQSRWRLLLPSPPRLLRAPRRLSRTPRRLSQAALFLSVWPSSPWWRTPWGRRRPCVHRAPLIALDACRGQDGAVMSWEECSVQSPSSSRRCLAGR
jgi:hypothetical protein